MNQKEIEARMATNTFKYIIVQTGAILFNEFTTHAMVAKGMGKVYSAGFVAIDNRGGKVVRVWGESESLNNLKSQPEKDQEVIEDLFAAVSKLKYLGFSIKNHYA